MGDGRRLGGFGRLGTGIAAVVLGGGASFGIVAVSTGVAAAIAATTPAGEACSHTGSTTTCTFSYTGAQQEIVVPAGVTSMSATAVGAAGSGGNAPTSGAGGYGGEGAQVTGTLHVSGSELLYVEVGGYGGWNGGGQGGSYAGAGGGASDVQTQAMTSTSAFSSRLIVAGGGGGGGGGIPSEGKGGAGGAAASGGSAGTSQADGTCTAGISGGGGAGGTTGGTDGQAQGGSGTRHTTGASGGSGSLGDGGSGGPAVGTLVGGGGGGGGYNGGGGGAGGGYAVGYCGPFGVGTGGESIGGGGGGGGGSSYATGVETAGSPTSSPASVTISWTGTLPAPVAFNGSYNVNENTTLTVRAPGLRTNGTSYGATLTVTRAPVHGTVTIHPDGAFTYVPTADYTGTDSFTYKEQNATGSATGTVDLRVGKAPAFSSARTATFSVGRTQAFTITASGTPSGATMLYQEAGALPSGLRFHTNGSGTATILGVPAPTTGGTYPLTLTATNTIPPYATQHLTLNVDQSPAITSAASTTFTVAQSGSFQATVTRHTYPAATYTETGALPQGVTLSLSGLLSGIPAAGTNGTYSILLTATNSTGPASEQPFTLTVDEAPSISSAASTMFTVGSAGSFTVTTAGTPAGSSMHVSEDGALPPGVTLHTNGNGTATLSGTPASDTGGAHPLTFTATNGVSPPATQPFTLSVSEAPVITSAASAGFAVGQSGSFQVTVTGHTSPAPTFTETGSLPGGVTLSPTGLLSGTPTAGTAGTYTITVIATNGVTPEATQTFTLFVGQAPVITSAPATTFTVGTTGTFQVTVTSQTLPSPTFTVLGSLPAGVTISPTGKLSGSPAPGTGGVYSFTIEATNGVAPAAFEPFTLTVDEAPHIRSTDTTTFTVGDEGSFEIAATGYPTAGMTLRVDGALPAGVQFTTTGNGAGTLSGIPAPGTGGQYSLVIVATNGVGTTTQLFFLTVDQAPSFTGPTSATFQVGQPGSFQITVTGATWPQPVEFFTLGGLPSGVTLSPTGSLSGVPVTGSGGTYYVTVVATNGGVSYATETFTLVVDEAPSFTSADAATFTAGTSGSFTITAVGYNPGTPVSVSDGGYQLPAGLTLVDTGSGVATLSGTPAPGTGGPYAVPITATNGVGTPTTELLFLTVEQAPTITSGDADAFKVGTPGSFQVTVTSATWPRPANFGEVGALPSGVTFSSSGVLSGTPAAGSGGTYPIAIHATNGAGTPGYQSFTLTVDQAPAITSSPRATLTTGSAGSVTIRATGYPAGSHISISDGGADLPAGLALVTNGNGTATLSGTPADGTGGQYTITLTAANGVTPLATQQFVLTVDEPPAFTSAASTAFVTGASSAFTLQATGYPSPTLSLTGSLPSGLSFTPGGGGTATLSGDPAAGSGGSYSLTITATNGIGSPVTQALSLTVDQAPAITSATSTTFVVGQSSSFSVLVSGYPAPAFSETGALPGGVTLSPTGTLSGTPATGTAGNDTITVTAANGVSPAGTQTFVLRVIGVPSAPRSLTVTLKTGKPALSWTGPSTRGNVATPVDYEVFRGTGAGAEGTTPLSTTTTTSYIDTTAVPGTTYYYVVKASNTVGSGPGSQEVHVVAGRETASGDGVASTPDGKGYWTVTSTGTVTAHGDAVKYGTIKSQRIHLNAPIVGMASTADGLGYWLVGADGGVFTFGDAVFYGSTGSMKLNRPVVGMAATPDGDGYWLVASDGGVFTFGDARFYGSTGSMKLNRPIVGMATDPAGDGYWLVASDGGVFTFGGVTFYGSTGGFKLNQPVVGMAATRDGKGYWLVASDGGVFTFGDASFEGSGVGSGAAPFIGIIPSLGGTGYGLVASNGGERTYG